MINRLLHITVTVLLLFSVQNSQAQHKKYQLITNPDGSFRGYTHIALAFGEILTPLPEYSKGLANLRDFMNDLTGISTHLDQTIPLSSPSLLELPIIFIVPGFEFELVEFERENLRRFIENGGFMVLDNTRANTDISLTAGSLRKMVNDTFGTSARFHPIPHDHEIYRSPFYFDSPPVGIEVAHSRSSPVYFLEGIWYKDRLIGVFTDKGYLIRWLDAESSETQLRLGINFIVYSLRQKTAFEKKP